MWTLILVIMSHYNGGQVIQKVEGFREYGLCESAGKAYLANVEAAKSYLQKNMITHTYVCVNTSR